MIDIVDFFKQQVDYLNTNSTCGECWNFGTPLREDTTNRQQFDDVCCVNVIIQDLVESQIRSYAETGFISGKTNVYALKLLLVKNDNLGTNIYNEILGHGINEGKWESILKPIKNCVTQDNFLQFCSIIGYNLEISTWRITPIINYLDSNYTGWKWELTLIERE